MHMCLWHLVMSPCTGGWGAAIPPVVSTPASWFRVALESPCVLWLQHPSPGSGQLRSRYLSHEALQNVGHWSKQIFLNGIVIMISHQTCVYLPRRRDTHGVLRCFQHKPSRFLLHAFLRLSLRDSPPAFVKRVSPCMAYKFRCGMGSVISSSIYIYRCWVVLQAH
jgi:hypothetical protein